jgi:SP family sugar:H+ symporter-like MFS transporter
MRFLNNKTEQSEAVDVTHGETTGIPGVNNEKPITPDATPPARGEKVTFIACFLGLVASIGGFMFGYVRYALISPLTLMTAST